MNRQNLPAQTFLQHLKDHPMPGKLSAQPDPLLVLRQQAVMHEHNRLETVAELLALTAILTVQRVLTGHEVITIGRAMFQFGQGDRAQGIQAAHCLPGHPYFNGLALHTVDEWQPEILARHQIKPLPLASKLRNLCGRTDYVDASLNQTDCLIEIMDDGRGLKPTLGRALHHLQQHLKHRPAKDWPAVGELVAQAMEIYRQHASYVCQERLHQLPFTNTSDATTTSKSHILESYLQMVQNGALIPEACSQHGFQQITRDTINTSSTP